MKISEQLRAGARYMREYGFSPEYTDFAGLSECGCFIHALNNVDEDGFGDDAIQVLADVIFDGDHNRLNEGPLRREGWNTDDAVAALEIAADCAEAEGK